MKSLAVTLLLFIAACAGSAARSNTLLPALQTAWPPIKAAAEREAEATASAPGLVAIAGADAAVQAGDPILVAAANWPLVDGLAAGDTARRLAAGAIGPGVAASLRERLAQFAAARETYTRTSR